MMMGAERNYLDKIHYILLFIPGENPSISRKISQSFNHLVLLISRCPVLQHVGFLLVQLLGILFRYGLSMMQEITQKHLF
jgi:hypothetical protein